MTAYVREAYERIGSIVERARRPVAWNIQILAGPPAALVDLSVYVTQGSVRIESNDQARAATCSFSATGTTAQLANLALENTVEVWDGDVLVFGGIIKSRTRKRSAGDSNPTYEIGCQDYSCLLADDVVDGNVSWFPYPPDSGGSAWDFSDRSFLAGTFDAFSSHGISAWDYVAIILWGAAALPVNMLGQLGYGGSSLFGILETITKLTGGQWYVDPYRRLHYFATETIAAPWNLSDTPNYTTTFPFMSISLTEDSVALANASWTLEEGKGIWSGTWYTDPTSITAYGRHEASITSLDPTNAGPAYVALHKDPVVAGTVRTRYSGLQAGMTVTITDAKLGLSAAPYRIASVVYIPRTPTSTIYELTLGKPNTSSATVLQDVATVAVQAADGVAVAQKSVNQRWRYVALDPYIAVVNGATTTGDTGVLTSAEMTDLPSTGVVAVQVTVIGGTTVAHNATKVMAFDYDGEVDGDTSVIAYMGTADYNSAATGTVRTGGTNNRQMKYRANEGSTGTLTYYVRVWGYWTTADA